jgi:hypothetical protein
MPIDAKFLTDALAAECDVNAKVAKILSEYEVDVNGLKVNRDAILLEKGKLEEKIKGFDSQDVEYKKQITDLSDKLKKSGTEDLKNYYEAQLKDMKTAHDNALKAAGDETAKYRDEALKFYRNDEFEKATKGLPIRPEVREDFRDLFYTRNQFERKEIDGQVKYINAEGRNVKNVLETYLQTDAGKFYLAQQNSGGSASGSRNVSGTVDFAKMNASQVNEFAAQGPNQKAQVVAFLNKAPSL